MTEIYACSKNAIVWLGMPDDSSEEFIKECNRIGGELNSRVIADKFDEQEEKTTFLKLVFEFATIPATAESKDRQTYLETSINEQLAGYYDEAAKDLPSTIGFLHDWNHMLARPYWNRVWIRQEFVVSPELLIQCGSSHIELLDLQAVMFYTRLMQPIVRQRTSRRILDTLSASPGIEENIQAWRQDGYPEPLEEEMETDPELYELKQLRITFGKMSEITISASTNNLFGMRRAYQDHHKKECGAKDRDSKRVDSKDDNSDPEMTSFTLLKILAKVYIDSTVEATEEKDRVFSMLSMASDREKLEALGVVTKYDKMTSVGATYTEVARALIQAGNVDVLSFAQHRPESVRKAKETPKADGRLSILAYCLRFLRSYLQWSKETTIPEMPAAAKEVPVPSWVPDWRNKIVRPCGQLPWDTTFNTCSDHVFKQTAGFSSCPQNELELSGWIVDTISSIGMEWKPTDDDYNTNHWRIIRWLTHIAGHCKMSNEKFKNSNVDVYTKDQKAYRESAHYLIPIADQEQRSIGFIQKAGPNPHIKAAHQDTFDNVGRNLMSDAANTYVNMMGWQRFRGQFLSKKGYVGLAPESVLFGDIIVMFEGAKLPYILRKCPKEKEEPKEGEPEEEDKYTLVGEAYVHGIMYGEFAEQVKESGMEPEVFCLK